MKYAFATCSHGVPVHRSVVSLALLVSLVSPACAQRLQAIWVRPQRAFAPPASYSRQTDSANHDVSRGVGGLIGAAGGFVIGAFAGAAVEKGLGCAGDDLCGLEGAVIGGTLGEGVGMALGVAAGGRGSHPLDVLLSTGIAVAGLVGAVVAGTPYVVIAVPVLQLAVLLHD